MSGIVGLIDKQNKIKNRNELIKKMCESINHNKINPNKTFKINLLNNEEFILGQLYCPDNMNNQKNFNILNDIEIFLDGDLMINNIPINGSKCHNHSFTNNGLKYIEKIYFKDRKQFLENIQYLEGEYNIIIIDENNKEFVIFNDRYGLKPLYYYIADEKFIFASEIKAILQDSTIERNINFQAMSEFFSFGYVLQNKTLIENVHVFPPGSALFYKNGNIRIYQYWNWKKIQKNNENLSEQQIVERLGNLWLKAINKRTNQSERVGVSLSGGLDSRAVISALQKYNKKIHAITFGKLESLKCIIAKKVCDNLGIIHHIVNLDNFLGNWIEDIEKTAYISDGHLNVFHMHSWEAGNVMKQYFDINMSGYAGDLILGGSFLNKNILKKLDGLDDALNDDLIHDLIARELKLPFEEEKHFYHQNIVDIIIGNSKKSVVDELTYWISDPNSTDFFYLNNRVRRFTLLGAMCRQTQVGYRKPFFDNELIDFVYGLPFHLRVDSIIYKKMLLKYFPQAFQDIPWKKTQLPIYPSMHDKLILILKKKFSWFKEQNNDYNIGEEIKTNETIKLYIQNLLLSTRCKERKLFNDEFINKLIGEHFSGKINHREIIGLLITFELFCRAFIDGDKID